MTPTLIILTALAVIVIYLAIAWRTPDMSQFDSPEHDLIIEEHEVSNEHHQVVAKLHAYHDQPSTSSVKERRRRFEEVFAKEVDINIRPVSVGNMDAEWVLAPGADARRRLLYIHGGAFIVGSPRTHRFITSELSRRTGCSVLAIDYRKQPEFKTIHCHEDARTAYDWVLANGPDGPCKSEALFVAGDSAGGNLTLAVIAWARDNGRQAANGAIALAPLTDVTMSSPSWQENLDSDHFLGPSLGGLLKVPALVRKFLARWSGGLPDHHPQLSPLFGNLAGLPPTLIQASKHEMLYGDAKRYTNKARHEGSEVTLQVWPTLVHVFQGFDNLPETYHAFDLMAEFIRDNAPVASEAA